MKSPHSGLFFAIMALVLIAGCSETVSPVGDNTGIPRGAFEGEYGFSLNGKAYDSGTPFINEGNASLFPFISQNANSLQLSLHLYFEFSDGTYGGVQIFVPLSRPLPQTISISSYQQDMVGSSFIDYDSVFWGAYESLPGGSITITKFDTVNNLISGTFNYTASQTSPTPNLNRIISITSGYFNDIPIGQGAYEQGSISAVVNDSTFTSNNAGREIVQANLNQGHLNLSADGQGILQNSEIGIQSIPLTLGTYTIKGPHNYSDTTLSFLYWSKTNVEISTIDSVSSGQLTITKCDIPNRRISGTFQFSGTDTLGNSVIITSGVINNVQWEP